MKSCGQKNRMENIEDLGLYLKTIREERKIPLAKIAQELKTKLEFVQAIESNDFDKFPAPTYVKGFLRSYAKYLEIDPEQILATYNKLYPEQPEQILILKGKEIPRIGLKINRLKLILWIGGTVILLLTITLGTTKISHFLKPKQKHTKSEKPASVKSAAGKPIPISLTTPISTPMCLSAKTTAAVWVRIYSDSKLIFEGILAKNEEKKWQAKTEFKLRIGNPAKLNLTINDRELGNIAPYGGPVNVVINEKGIKVEK